MSHKSEIVTFKVETELAELIQRIPNKSEFIRQAILASLKNTCPLCQGSGVLSPQQRTHWDEFAAHHAIEKCDDCDAVHIHCQFDGSEHAHDGQT